MRISPRRILIVVFLVFLSFIIWSILSNESSSEFTQTCNQPEKFQHDLHVMTHSVHVVLEHLNITNFLCYGSLWGQLRLSRILPWEDKTVLCILNEAVLAKDELLVARVFKSKGFIISYDSIEGIYNILQANQKDHRKPLKVILIVFELDKVVDMYRRIGWKRRVLPPDCETLSSLDCFPPRLIRPPLQRKEFGGKLIPVPREGIEIQKYHFRDNWWKEITYKNC
ncbi:UNVERIFIED_CONTAM: hypothetical protein PYX00_008993 [Menopon gallinae]|uniref:Uncharacterized protein n=1 Tax=Menopon gallinae TaxID=328185 RepID=A0AAW2H9Q9_9NEOP